MGQGSGPGYSAAHPAPGEYSQPSDPGRERLRQARQPLATTVQEAAEAAAGSGAQALGGAPGRLPPSPVAAALGPARAPQCRTQQQPQRRDGRAEPRRAHRGPAALGSVAGARSARHELQPRAAARALLSRARVSAFLLTPAALEQRRETQCAAERPARAAACGARRSPQQKLSRPPRGAARGPGAAEAGGGACGADARPLAGRLAQRPRDRSRVPAPVRARERVEPRL